MRVRMSLAIVVAATCLALTGAASSPQAGGRASAPSSGHTASAAALRLAADQCGAGEICFWHDRNFSGAPWRWMPSNGYRDMPPNLHDHVYSFYANVRACFIDYKPRDFRAVNIGDYAKAYDTNFGRRIDAVAVRSSC
ncbi:MULTISPECIES: peptidase inhibitor family I36 protein [unclassified Streptomyces]|uniref:peptidase inhibitor family I36 protein n=1 Tax=unclassified Streptomyces TaxID=2593676 RepID=UPI00324FA15D